MRLTLRTLLAYLDDILDPSDKEQLAKKIESSEFAEDLVHRTRDTMRRLRLSAPQVIGSGMGLDPNTVAEYLDNVLPPESVGDFERICLESDMHLAEAAACHHVLTMVLGEPADVDPLARQRMYTIQNESDTLRRVRLEPAHTAIGVAPVAAMPIQAVAVPTGGVTREAATSEVPDYLRASGWGGARMAMAAVAAVVLIAGAIFFVPGLRDRLFGGTSTELAAGPSAGGETAPNTAPGIPPLELAPTVDEAPAVTTTMEPAAPSATEPDRYAPLASADTTTQPSVTPSSPGDATSVPTGVGAENGVPAASSTAPSAGGPTDIQPPVANDIASTPPQVGSTEAPPTSNEPTANIPNHLPATTEPGSTGVTGNAENTVAAAEPNVLLPPTPNSATDVSASNVPVNTVEPAATDEVPAGPVELGMYVGEKTVLLRHDDANNAWFRVEPRHVVIAGERLLALPQFRPKIQLALAGEIDLSGGTQVILRSATDEAAGNLPAVTAVTPLFEVVYGRMVVTNTSNAENQLRLKLGTNVYEARLASNAKLGIEVERQYLPGHDPRQSSAPVVIRLFAPDGGVRWQDAAGEKSADSASRWTITEGVTSDIAADPSPPDWIDHEPAGQLSEQRYAAPRIESTLVSNRPVDIQLIELFQSMSRREVKSLVAKCAIHVGVFQPFIEALRDSDQKSNWSTHIDMLRAAMALGPDSATNVMQALVEQREHPAADELYEMLCGYSADQIGHTPEQVKTGAVAKLIDRLENDSLDFRVLAVHNLFEITGKRLMLDPAADRAERSQNVRRWRTRLQAGDLMPANK